MATKIDVTLICMTNGVCGSPGRCMLAEAIRPHLKPGCEVRVYPAYPCQYEDKDGHRGYVLIFPNDAEGDLSREHEIELTKEVNAAAYAFDEGDVMPPFSFDMDIPQEYLK